MVQTASFLLTKHLSMQISSHLKIYNIYILCKINTIIIINYNKYIYKGDSHLKDIY